MKKRIIIIASTICSLLVILGLTIGILAITTNIFTRSAISNLGFNNILSKQEVDNNFNNEGIWKDKTYLNADDLASYDAIDTQAFDGINLEYIELDANLDINFSAPFIKWEGINEIRLNENNLSNKLYIFSNVLYHRTIFSSTRYDTISITNRLDDKISIEFPNSKNFVNNSNNYKFCIVDNFYSLANFKNNIEYVNLNQEGSISYVDWIGSEAFLNCQVLDEVVSLDYHSHSFLPIFIIGKSAFDNTNISKVSLNIYGKDWSSITYIGKKAFYNCEYLNDIYISSEFIGIGDYAFSNLNSSLSFKIIAAHDLIFGNNIFANEISYSNFNVDITYEIIELFENSFSQITMNDENNFTFSVTNKVDFINSGLTKEQYNKII